MAAAGVSASFAMIACGDFCGRDVRSVAHLLSGKQPTADQIARMRASTEQFLAHLIRPTTNFRPDIGVLRASPVGIVVGAGSRRRSSWLTGLRWH